eukprot:GILI01024633.1.p1 GENE.GILI01024633.1~~GILI01024633.1.p1  ORF type:complete len:409 (-),score=50.51 GILI01024633.1:120-1346(-)
MSPLRNPFLGYLARGKLPNTTPQQLVGISFDVQDTLLGFMGKRRVGDAYLACAHKFLKERYSSDKRKRDEIINHLPTADQIVDRFRIAYKAGVTQRRKRYTDAVNLRRGNPGAVLDNSVCPVSVDRHVTIDEPFDANAVPFGGFTQSEAEADWIEVLSYIFGQPISSATASSSPPPPSSNASAPVDASILRPLAKAIYDDFGTAFPFQPLASTRHTLLSLRLMYPQLPITAVTNNDVRVVGILDSLKLFPESEKVEDNAISEDLHLAQELMKIHKGRNEPREVSSLTIGDLIDTIVTPSVTGAAKPHSGPLREAIWQCYAMSKILTSESNQRGGQPIQGPPIPYKSLSDPSLPPTYKGWVHVGDHAADKIVAHSVPQCSFVWCSPTSGPTLANIEYCLEKHGVSSERI